MDLRRSRRPAPEQLDDAIAAVEITLDADEIKKLEDPYVPHPVSGFI
jgi:aryl-alcohol dehydrogenase (NADP+)